MGTLQTSGAISLSDLQTQLGGANPIGLSEYYRGGSYVPSTRTTSTNVSEGPTYVANVTYWYVDNSYADFRIYWGGFLANVGSGTSYTISGKTYYRGGFYTQVWAGNRYLYYYYISRTYTTTTVSNINTSVPTSGQISLSQLYGSANP